MSSERRGAEVLLLDSIRAFQSMLLKVMVAVWKRWLQRRDSGSRKSVVWGCESFGRMRGWNDGKVLDG